MKIIEIINMKIIDSISTKLLILSLAFVAFSCNLDYDNKESISPNDVWFQKQTINAFMNDIHASSIPAWPLSGTDSDEGMVWNGVMSDYLRGVVSKETTTFGFNYGVIERINFFLDKLANIVPETVLSKEERDQLEGQARFWRAWWYWSRVSAIGGIPIIDKPQDVTNLDSLFVPRNSTSECMKFILDDLDAAITKLPGTWKNADYGKVDKCAALAFKGRILLHYASPLFNPGNDPIRWQKAYDANKEAVDFLRSQGKDLYPKFGDIWYNERNCEVVMVNQFSYPDHAFNQAAIRPLPFSKALAENDTPILSSLLAFPKKDGSSMELDREKLKTDPEYNKQFMDDFYLNRDDRFYATVFCGGTLYPGKNILPPNQRFWSTWRKDKVGYRSMYLDQGGTVYTGKTGFNNIKGLDISLDASTSTNAETDWIPIRFAEVLMNYGECANQVSKANEALQVLYDIRKRAGILAGVNGRYGITATTKEQIQEAYIAENFAEFAFEGKRIIDLRRWKRYDMINNQKYRSVLYCVLNEDEDVKKFDFTKDISEVSIRHKFHFEVIENIYQDESYRYNLDLNHWFYALGRGDLDRNSKLEQNNEWEGTFDPLK